MSYGDMQLCQVPGCNSDLQRGFMLFPRDPSKRVQWAQALQMTVDDTWPGYRVCSKHFSQKVLLLPDSINSNENAVPLPWNRNPAHIRDPKCRYIRENAYPQPPLNRFVKDQLQPFTADFPKISYADLMLKIEAKWCGLSAEERNAFAADYSIEKQLWEGVHNELHTNQEVCPSFTPMSSNSNVFTSKTTSLMSSSSPHGVTATRSDVPPQMKTLDEVNMECEALSSMTKRQFKQHKDIEGTFTWHFRANQYACKKCQQLLSSTQSAFSHHQRHLEAEKGLKYRCHKCLRIFDNTNSIRNHLRENHGLAYKREEMRKFKRGGKKRKPKSKN